MLAPWRASKTGSTCRRCHPPTVIVDCHVHLNDYHADRRAPTEEHLARLRAQMDKHGLDHCMVLTSYLVNTERPSAKRLLDLMADDPRLHVVEGLGVTAPEPVDWEAVGQRLRDRLTLGLKIYPGYEHVYPTDKAFLPAIELAAKHRVPIMIHTGDTYAPRGKLKYAHPLHVDEVAVDHPDVDFIICHMGNPWFRDTAEIIYKNQNVHADISGLVLEQFTAPLEKMMREDLEEVILYTGDPDSILYGTDWPLVSMGAYLRFVEQLNLEAEHREALMGKNAARIFRLPT
jgi:uncharacterized protein